MAGPPGYGYPMVPPMGQPPLIPMMPPPVGPVPGMPMQPLGPALMPTPLSAPAPTSSTDQFAPVHVPLSTANMKVATTVFVGNISDKATDTLVRQMLLRCGSIVGWKRVQDASGKLQAFGFCEYSEPDSTLRALRILHDRKLGDKPLVVKVDAKTRKDLLKYVARKKKERDNESVDDEALDKLVAEMESKSDSGLSSLTEILDEDMKIEDEKVNDMITSLLKQHLEVLTSSKSTEDIQREHDVKESILFMAKQCGTLDPESTLDDMEMEEGMKTLVSDEIKRFRQTYKVCVHILSVLPSPHYTPTASTLIARGQISSSFSPHSGEYTIVLGYYLNTKLHKRKKILCTVN